MPFISNNKCYQMVNDDAVWDKSEFVLVRKLFMQFEQVPASETLNVIDFILHIY